MAGPSLDRLFLPVVEDLAELVGVVQDQHPVRRQPVGTEVGGRLGHVHDEPLLLTQAHRANRWSWGSRGGDTSPHSRRPERQRRAGRFRSAVHLKLRRATPGILATAVEGFLDRHPGFLGQLVAAPTLNPAQVRPLVSPDLDRIIEAPPEAVAPTSTSRPWLSLKVRMIDFAELDAANRRLGKLGEQFVFDLERYRFDDCRS